MKHTFERDGQAAVIDPPWPLIEDLLAEWLSPPARFRLGDEAGGHVEASGTRQRLTLQFRERRVTAPGQFRAWVLGRGETCEGRTTLETPAGPATVYLNEVLSLKDALNVFAHFYEWGTVPTVFRRREVGQHAGQQAGPAPARGGRGRTDWSGGLGYAQGPG